MDPVSAVEKSAIRPVEGLIPFTRDGETYNTYYKLFGNIEGRTRTPLVVLHGGPGLSHHYLLPIADLAEKYGIPVIFYDQLGNGGSTHLKEKPETFWTVDLFMDELTNLLRHFSIEDAYDLLGHSWGGILASEFAVERQPAGLQHLVIADSLASSALWGQSTMELLKNFPQEVQDGIVTGMKEPARYYEALKVFHAVHGCTLKPWPEEITHSFDLIFGPDGDPTVSSSPLLKDWTIIDRLHTIKKNNPCHQWTSRYQSRLCL